MNLQKMDRNARRFAFKASMLAAINFLAACGPTTYVSSAPADPCEPSYYNAPLCQQAIAANGFYYQGAFVPHVYVNPFSFYSSGYTTYTRGGGRVYSVSPSYYSRTYSAPSRVYTNNPRTTYQPSTVPSSRPSVVNPTARAYTPRSTVISAPPSYSRPSYSPSYSAPRSTYSAPRSTYSAPRPSYSSPSRSSYSSPSRSSSSGSSSYRRRP